MKLREPPGHQPCVIEKNIADRRLTGVWHGEAAKPGVSVWHCEAAKPGMKCITI